MEESCDLNISFESNDFSFSECNKSNSEYKDEIIENLSVSYDDSTEFKNLDLDLSNSSLVSKGIDEREPDKMIKCQMDRLLNHSLRYNSSFKNMESMASVINSTPNAAVNLPSTKHTIKKCMSPQFRQEFHIKCSTCGNYTTSSKSEAECISCNLVLKAIKSKYFITIPIGQQLKHFVQKHIEKILVYNSSVLRLAEITDLHNGEIYKQARKMHPNSIILPLIVNTDGVQVYKCSNNSLWMIQLYQGYLPPSIRYNTENILIVAANFDRKKPHMPDFFYPLLSELRTMIDSGDMVIISNGIMHRFVPLSLSSSCDLPAKADLQAMIGHTGRYGCSYCLHPGISVKGEKKAVIRYVRGNNYYSSRSHEETIEIYSRLKSDPIYGIKNKSCMVAAYDFNLIDSFAIEPMHNLHLGVTKKIVSL